MAFKGNPNGTILVVADGLKSRDEKEQDTPFVGPAGWKLKAWIEGAGIKLNDVMFATLEENKHYSMPNLNVVVPMGEKTLGLFLDKAAKLDKVRGSIYNVHLDLIDKWVKFIPTLHPDDALFNIQVIPRCISDWRKIKEQNYGGQYTAPERNHNIAPDITDIEAYYDSLRPDSVVSMDIETWGGSIKCIGFSSDERESIVIPTELHYWKKRTGIELDLETAWDLIKDICEHPCEKVMQNGLFDTWWLEEYGIHTQGFMWDTMGMHHALYPRDKHSLDFLASIYTNQPYWKDEAKEADEIVKVAKQGMDKLYVYNGLDCTVTHEIYQRLKEELVESGYLDFYKRHYSNMFEPLLSLMRYGVAVSVDEMATLRAELLGAARALRDEAGKLAGEPLFIFDKTSCERDMLRLGFKFDELVELGHKPETIERKWEEMQGKGVSDTLLLKYLEGLGLPKSATGVTKTGKMKADNISLRKVQKYYEDRKRPDKHTDVVCGLVDTVLSHRRKKKLASFLQAEKIDTDGRLRCTYSFNTKTGRLSSRSNPRGTGMNLQNIDRSLRGLFVASPGRLLLEIDLSRAENRVVGALTGVDYMLEAARRPTTGLDVYKERTAGIYSVLWDREVGLNEITGEMRRLGKEVVLAAAYGMRGNTFSDNMLKKLGVTLTPNEAQKLLDADMAKQPAIREWQSDVRKIIMRDRYLFTSWGRSVDFIHDRMDDTTYRFAYCYVPQSEIADLVNQFMLIPTHNVIKQHKLKSKIIMQVHDALIIDAVPEEIYNLMRFIGRSVEVPRLYGQAFGRSVELVVPCEYSLGTAWNHATDWKTLPTKEEVKEVCERMLNDGDRTKT